MMDRLRPWLVAARPATLWASVTPVVVAAALAAADDVWRGDVFAVLLAVAALLQVAVNYANDLEDAVRGVDTATRTGPLRAVASGLIAPATMRVGIVVIIAMAAVAGLYIAWVSGAEMLLIGVVAVAAALGYSGGPRPYASLGLGEVSVFVFFGPVATVGSRYAFDRTAPEDAWVASVVMGLLATAILVANNLRDIPTDAASGKRTLAVRIGAGATRRLYLAVVALAFGTVAVGTATGWLPPWSALALGAAPLVLPAARAVTSGATGARLVPALVGTARLMAITGALLAVGALV
ncbi:MAG: 1,4-dihydroxy-2-naphthoate polyprenyltransferase [Acidimicrobiia bacterium]|nr:1,4-dihydroxy-2-naphthoate polyprenyltransferase [Acidimicrobiia bacterium]